MKIACARKNAEIYGVADRIEFIVGDFFHIMPHLKVAILLCNGCRVTMTTFPPCSQWMWYSLVPHGEGQRTTLQRCLISSP